MLLWLLYPTAKCAVASTHEVEIGEVDQGADVWETDKERVEQGLGFFSRWKNKIKVCYAGTPIHAQEPWKKGLALALAGLTILFWTIDRLTRPRRSKLD